MRGKFGLPLRLGAFKGWIHPSYDHPSFKEAISDCHRLLRQAQCQILIDRRNRVGSVTLEIQNEKRAEVVIKEFKIQGVNRIKSLFLPSKAFKAWKGAAALVEEGIATPFPIAYLERRKKGLIDESFYLAEKLSGVEEIRFLFLNSPLEELRALVHSLAHHLSHCHEKGLLHRDLSDGNVLVKREDGGTFRFYFIDTNRVRFSKKISLLRRVKNLIRLGIPPHYQHFFLEQYLGSHRFSRSLWLWYRVNKAVYGWFVAVKRKLRLRQMAQKLKIQ